MTEQCEEQTASVTDETNQVYNERKTRQYIHEQCLISSSLSKNYTDAVVSDVETEQKLLSLKVYFLGIVALFQSAIILWILGR